MPSRFGSVRTTKFHSLKRDTISFELMGCKRARRQASMESKVMGMAGYNRCLFFVANVRCLHVPCSSFLVLTLKGNNGR